MSPLVLIDDTNPSIQYSGPWFEVENTQINTHLEKPICTNMHHGSKIHLNDALLCKIIHNEENGPDGAQWTELHVSRDTPWKMVHRCVSFCIMKYEFCTNSINLGSLYIPESCWIKHK